MTVPNTTIGYRTTAPSQQKLVEFAVFGLVYFLFLLPGNHMKTVSFVLITALFVLVSPAYATHDLAQPSENQQPADSHLSWHEFRHDLGAFPSAVATMDENGVITLSGHTDSAYEKSQLNRLAERVNGASEIKNRILTD